MRRRTFLAGLGFAALQLAGCAAKPQTTPDYVLNFIQMAIRGLFAVYWYKKESERRIHRVYDRCPEGPQRSDALAATGGTSWAAVFIYLGVYIAAGVLGSFLMGPDLNAVIRFLTM